MTNRARPIRISDELWQKFGEVAASRGLPRSALIRAYMEQEIERSQSAGGDLFDPPSGNPLSGRQSTRGKR